MTREEKLKRIEEIKQAIFDIDIGIDNMTPEQNNHVRELYSEKWNLEAGLKEEDK